MEDILVIIAFIIGVLIAVFVLLPALIGVAVSVYKRIRDEIYY